MSYFPVGVAALGFARVAEIRPPARRLFIAIALSALIHAVILLTPKLQLPHKDLHLPPLNVRLELVPKRVDKPSPKPQQAKLMGKKGVVPVSKKLVGTANTMQKMEKSTAPSLFPKHLQITFAVFNGAGLAKSGELRHQLDIDGDRYTLKAIKQAVGLAVLQNNEQLIQTSYGRLNEHGLQPDTFTHEIINKRDKQSLEATFDRKAQRLIFSNGVSAVLSDDSQDILSFMYQLSQLSMQREIIPLPISDSSHLEQTRIEIYAEEEISTPLGNLRTLHLRKMHVNGEAYFEIWLGLEYRLFPVKFRQVNGLDKVTEEFVISDIRAED
jgi:hypothetical protein